VLLALVTLAGCGGAATPASSSSGLQGSLTVYAAASLTEAFNQVRTDLEAAHPGLHIAISYAGSQVLRTQLAQGAKADVFASADSVTMDGAVQDGSIQGPPVVFAHNKLAVVIPASDAKVSSLQDLGKEGTKVVLEQASVPAGNYARQALAKMSQDPSFGAGFSDKVLANVVSEEPDVKSVLARIQLGEADAGILYTSDVLSAQRGTVKSLGIPDQFNVIADYPIGQVKGAPNAAAAAAFIEYVAHGAGQATLQKYGLLPASG
jgi:molybdate transport system substrate-binding protein